MSANRPALTLNLVLQRSRKGDPSHVKQLNAAGLALEDVSVLRSFPYLELCSLAANEISDLESLSHCRHLQELHLRKNRIHDFEQVLYLSHLPLRAIGFSENPIAAHEQYRRFVIAALPKLLRLDDQEVTPSERADAERAIPDPFATAAVMNADLPSSPAGPAGGATFTRPASSAPADAAIPRRAPAQSTAAPLDAAAGAANAYNGDDIPIGGGVRAPRPRMTPRPAQSAEHHPAPSRPETAHHQPAQPHREPLLRSTTRHSDAAASDALRGSAPVASASTRIPEDSAVAAVCVLLNAMTPAGLASVQRHLDALAH